MKNEERKETRPPASQSRMDSAPGHLGENDEKPEADGQRPGLAYLAHSKTDAHPQGHTLKRHLTDTADMAASFFQPESTFPSDAANQTDRALAELAKRIALHHDAGKYKMAFQRRVREEEKERVDHSTLGGILLAKQYGPVGRMLAFATMGHHGGMPNGVLNGGGRSLEQRLADRLDDEAVAAFQREMEPATEGLPALAMRLTRETAGFETAMMLRMLFSALVDADYLDTERYFHPEQYALRGKRPDISTLFTRYEDFMAQMKEKAKRERTAAETVNQHRDDVLAWCLAAGALPPGFFSLTVPTGGGKTLASLGFALCHCAAHPTMRRIIYAIPFTSIIEQNAEVFRNALGNDAVLEHHSAVRPSEDGSASDLATENWDAPLIVTTNVQLFDSLYANKPSRCRKLHNLRNAVIILDEAQALPDGVLRPCLMALVSLVKNHGATVLLCTATQPEWSAAWPEKPDIREIIPDVGALYAALRRTRTTFLRNLSDEALLARLDAETQALCIVNSRAHAQALYRTLAGREGVYHLSALMCPKHRTKVLSMVKERLQDKSKPRCILIATPVVEAGVDIDFPVVYRALAGLDSVAQAAGRCNRAGLLGDMGEVYVFVPEAGWKAPPDVVRQGQMAELIAKEHDDLLGKPAQDTYFRQRFGYGADLDKKKILNLTEEHGKVGLFPFECIAAAFEMIQSAGEPLVIPYDDEGRAIIKRLENPDAVFLAMREARQYAVNIYPHQRDALAQRGMIAKVGDMWVLNVSNEQMELLYDAHCGLTVDKEPRLAALFS